MKNLAAVLAFAAVLNGAQAQSEPVVGMWEKLAVSDENSNLVARVSYVFTEKKLTEETVFTGIQNDDPLTIICCVKVKNLKPIELKDVIAKYSMDREFVDHMKSINGAPFMYEAVPVDKKEWNPLMNAIMRFENDPDYQTPHNVPVISAKLGAQDEKLGKLELGPTKTKLKVTYAKKQNKATYEFTINNKKIVLSEKTFPAE